jgi:RNA polymerase sigma-70 factor (ECF subfamily)
MERISVPAGVRRCEKPVKDDDRLDELYRTSYRRLVSVVGAVAGDRAEAEDVVQEAFVRLMRHWSKVSAYDDPEAWVRRVALGILSNRRRKARNALSALRRQDRLAHGPEPDPARVDLDRALDRLPLAQRQVVVLQHLGMSVPDIASQLEVPEGTVKSRLSRAKVSLAATLTGDPVRHD